MNVKLAIFGFLLLWFFHHDSWNWDNKTLWLGFLPAGLGYQAIFSLVAALFWALVNRFAWPHQTEVWADGGEG